MRIFLLISFFIVVNCQQFFQYNGQQYYYPQQQVPQQFYQPQQQYYQQQVYLQQSSQPVQQPIHQQQQQHRREPSQIETIQTKEFKSEIAFDLPNPQSSTNLGTKVVRPVSRTKIVRRPVVPQRRIISGNHARSSHMHFNNLPPQQPRNVVTSVRPTIAPTPAPTRAPTRPPTTRSTTIRTTEAPTVAPVHHKPAVPAPVSHLSPGKSDPNSVFLSCCKGKNVAKSCESRCNFDILTKKILTGMFLGTDKCPQSHGLDLFSCAAQDSDHTPCCRRMNVQKTGAGDKCLAFCKMTPDSMFQADASYLPCWAVLNKIKTCFRDAIINGIET
uniref:Uncharacterized protein n=2 Tax=Panagrolaimus sp. JU765 TaxID=591449 RepID=A0AC34QWP6_9BILA